MDNNVIIYNIFANKINKKEFNCDLSIYNTVSKLQNYLKNNIIEFNDDKFVSIFFNAGKLLKANTEIDCFDTAIICYQIYNKLEQNINLSNSLMSIFNLEPEALNIEPLPSNSLSIDITNDIYNLIAPMLNNISNNQNNLLYETETQTIIGMGFGDYNSIRDALLLTGGNIDSAVDILLNQL